jgi:hypothetical protein
VIRLLLQSNILTRLSFHRGTGFLHAGHFDAVLADAPPQPLLQKLRVLTADVRCLHVPAIAAALAHAPLLTSLAMYVPGEKPRGAMRAIGVLAATLQLLQLEFDADAVLHGSEILTLRTLTQLGELVIQPPMNRTFCFLVAAPEFTDADLVHLLTGLPELRRFVYGGTAGWWENNDRRLLQRIGHAAPLLEELGLAGSYSVQALEPLAPTPAFPCLQTLLLCKISLALPHGDLKHIERLQLVFLLQESRARCA